MPGDISETLTRFSDAASKEVRNSLEFQRRKKLVFKREEDVDIHVENKPPYNTLTPEEAKRTDSFVVKVDTQKWGIRGPKASAILSMTDEALRKAGIADLNTGYRFTLKKIADDSSENFFEARHSVAFGQGEPGLIGRYENKAEKIYINGSYYIANIEPF